MRDYNLHGHKCFERKATKREKVELVVCGVSLAALAGLALVADLVMGAQ